jgi:DNA-binding NarL/FixJ family response regulator
VFCATGGSLRIWVTCARGEEKARDQEMALALWGRLLGRPTSEPEHLLSAQERQVYRLLRRGLSYKEIAGALGVAHSTVRVQVAAIRKKLGNAKVPVLRQRSHKLV